MRSKINHNSYYDPSISRIDILDNRFYLHEDKPGVYYPSSTTVLEAYPKGPALVEWHKALGFNADIILEQAARKGTNVHAGIDIIVNGGTLTFGIFNDNKFIPSFTLEEWEMLCKFVEFWNAYKPSLIACEVSIVSDRYKLGGTIDLVFNLVFKNKMERWLLDTKTGNSIYPSHELQIASYAMMWNEKFPNEKIDRCGILHLQALTRSEGTGHTIQGPGWKIHEFDRHYTEGFKLFEACRIIWDNENPNYKPKNLSYPSTLSINS